MKQRVITAILAIAAFLPILFFGGKVFHGLLFILATIGLYELIKMKQAPIFSFPSIVSFFLMWTMMLSFGFQDFLWETTWTKSHVIYFTAIILLIYTVVSKNKFHFDDAGFYLLASLYVGVSFYYFYLTRELGLSYLLFVLFIIWAADSGAYQVGVKFGKHKLWPAISPKKSIEGFVGGIASAVIVAILFYIFAELDFSLVQHILLGVLIAFTGTLGDLVESAFKRHYNVKDSGSLLPGHGGILDRFDSLLFTLPILYSLNLMP